MRIENSDEAGSPEREGLARRLDRPMGVLGLVFVLVVLGQSLARKSWLVTVLSVVGWLCWGVFVAEFLHRAMRARDRRRFWARNWWQVLFLALPFLRFARALTLLRAARLGGVVSAAVRASRSAGRLLSGRVGWLAAVTGVVSRGQPAPVRRWRLRGLRAGPARDRPRDRDGAAADRAGRPCPDPRGGPRGLLGGGLRHPRRGPGRLPLDDRHRAGAPPEVSAAPASNRPAAGTGAA